MEPTNTGLQNSVLANISNDLAEAVEKAALSVVRVDARRRQSASGLVWDSSGLIVTADHVLEREDDINVGLADGTEVTATILGRDPGSDIALLRVQRNGLTPFEQASDPKVGHLALAVGRPGPGGPMATIGIISAVGGPSRTWRGGRVEEWIRTDAVLYPGFSGGPLVNVSGQMLGLNTSFLSQTTSIAIPTSIISATVASLLQHGKVRRGFLGITSQMVALPERLQQRFNIRQDTALLIFSVQPNGPADKSGLMMGDILIRIDAESIHDSDDLQGALTRIGVGRATTLGIVRGGEIRDVSVTVGERT